MRSHLTPRTAQLSQLHRAPHATHRDGGHNPRNDVRRLAAQLWRPDRTRTNDVRADMTALQISGPGSHKSTDGSLGRTVDTKGGSTLNVPGGTRENDRAAIIQ